MMDRDSKQSRTATIAISETESGAIDLGGLTAIGLYMPAAFDGLEITPKVCDTIGGTYVSEYDTVTEAEITVPVTTGVFVRFASPVRAPFLKLASSAAESAARTIRVACVEGV